MKTIAFSKNIFIVGLGGSGKTTSGSLLAKKLNFNFIDLDDEFRKNYGDIGDHISKFGSQSYGYKNSKLFLNLIEKHRRKTVFVLPPGFVVNKKLGNSRMTSRHLDLMQKNGLMILLLPSADYNQCLQILLKRQLRRGLGYNKKGVRKDVSTRFSKFKKLGDIKIFSVDKPDKIVNNIVSKLTRL
jgi:shikimate kinase